MPMFPWRWNVCGPHGTWILFTWQIWITGEKRCDDILQKYCTEEDDPLTWGHCSSAFCLLMPLVFSERREKNSCLDLNFLKLYYRSFPKPQNWRLTSLINKSDIITFIVYVLYHCFLITSHMSSFCCASSDFSTLNQCLTYANL